MNYKYVKLGDLVSILSGFAFDSKLFNNEIGVPLIRIRDVVRGHSATYYSGNYDNKYLVQNGDVLIGMDGEFNIAKWKGGNSLLNQRVCKITPSSEKLDPNYLFRFLPKELKSIENATSFVTVKHLSTKTLQEIQIPLPPLDEQRRIAEVLDCADALREKRRLALQKLDTLLQSIFLEMFSRNENSHWKYEKIENLLDTTKGSIRTGPFGSQLLHSEFTNEGIAVLGIDNVVKNKFTWDKLRFISEQKYKQLKRYTVFPNDVLISIMGTCGKSAIVPANIPLSINTKHLCCITLNQKKCLPSFLHACFLLHPEVLRNLKGSAKGAIMPGLNMGLIKSLEIPLPPIELQNQFAEIAKKIEALKDKKLNASKRTENLFQSLQQRAFKGELFSGASAEADTGTDAEKSDGWGRQQTLF